MNFVFIFILFFSKVQILALILGIDFYDASDVNLKRTRNLLRTLSSELSKIIIFLTIFPPPSHPSQLTCFCPLIFGNKLLLLLLLIEPSSFRVLVGGVDFLNDHLLISGIAQNKEQVLEKRSLSLMNRAEKKDANFSF